MIMILIMIFIVFLKERDEEVSLCESGVGLCQVGCFLYRLLVIDDEGVDESEDGLVDM